MTDLNRLTNILVDVGDSVNALLVENRRMRHVLTTIAEAAEETAADWRDLQPHIMFCAAHPCPIGFATETAERARAVFANAESMVNPPAEEPQSREDSDGQTHPWPRR